jgi:hypothetical protein
MRSKNKLYSGFRTFCEYERSGFSTLLRSGFGQNPDLWVGIPDLSLKGNQGVISLGRENSTQLSER